MFKTDRIQAIRNHSDETQTRFPWLLYAKPRPQAKLRLFCFASAGHGGTIYHAWNDHLPSNIELYPLELPGRGPHLARPAYHHLTPLLDELIPVLQPVLTKPFAFFGHSMGGLIAFALAQELRRRRLPEPVHLLVSATSAPQLRSLKPQIHQLPDNQFFEQLHLYRAGDFETPENRELEQLMLPTLRADFSLCETYRYESDGPFLFPISAYGGLADQTCLKEELAGWQCHTRNSFTMQMFNGGHFYWFEQVPAFVTHIARTLEGHCQG